LEDLSRERIEQVALFIGIAVALTTLFVLLAIGGASLGWTGFADKTFWDWLQLLSALAIPVVLAAAGLWFTAQQDARQHKFEDQRADEAQNIENLRANAERELAEQRAQDEALQAYLNQMSSLLEKGLRDSDEGSEVRTVARARTLTVLPRLDSSRKELLLQFLYEAKLIQKGSPVIDFEGVDLRGIDLSQNNLSGGPFLSSLSSFTSRETMSEFGSDPVDLSGANLSNVKLYGAQLNGVDLSDANLSQAHLGFAQLPSAELSNANFDKAGLKYANLKEANLSNADLSNANLKEAWLKEADLTWAYLGETTLSHATLSRANLSNAWLNSANLSYAHLNNANLSNSVHLNNANLSNAHLNGAQLNGAHMANANMYGAQGISDEEVKAQASSFGGATMPTGQKIAPHEARPLKPGFAGVDPGEYVTDKVFEPAFRFKGSWAVDTAQMSAPWQVYSQKVSPETDEDEALVFSNNPWPEGGQLTFTRPLHVFDPSNPSEPKEVAAPENADEWVSWFQSHPNLETSKPMPESVGGASGMRIDVRATSTLENYPRDDCVQPCVFLYPAIALECCDPPEVSGTSIQRGSMRIYEEIKDQYIIVDVKGGPVVINVSAPKDKFDEFLVKAQKILSTVEWESG
jgi:uncharacterized protein YjbI with pentapeptide repeats